MSIHVIFSSYIIFFFLIHYQVNSKILTECNAANELRKSGISGTFISNWVCLMKTESGLNTNLVKNNGPLASASFGIFQISSLKNTWCIRGRKGGKCNAKCEDFANDDISDDIGCAQKIQEAEGFKYWKGWLNKCKDKPLPDVSNCRKRRYSGLRNQFGYLNFIKNV